MGNNPPPVFGSDFNPHVNPIDPNNPYAAPPPLPPDPQEHLHPKPHGHVLTEEEKHNLSELAKHKPKDSQGHWTKTSNIPPIIEVNQNTEPSEKEDPPLFGFFITNPVTYLKLFLKRLIRRQAITLRIPVLALIVIMVGVGGFGVGFQSGLNWALFRLFPNYSPILHRAITEQGTIYKNNKGEYFLKSDSKEKTLWTLKSVSENVKLEEYIDQAIQIKGNLTPTPNLIEVSEVISFATEKPTPAPTIAQTTPLQVQSSPPPKSDLPALYSGLTWEVTQTKTLIFTSGKRKIEQQGVYLESSQVNILPQEFINYYTQQLTLKGFKETLNSKDPDGITITYSKDDLFLTFGVKNVTKGTGDSKQTVGYKAYIEHN